ncbi:MAG: glucose-1-phosphate adenylyltransferase [Thermodesulfobacteriota bacterium]|nr:glucose-1-phosphate adenylyltransferase [Thermodesulfobacteriota bacterium]
MKLLTFILAGGKGERLYPLTRDRAKPAVPFGGIYRIIDFTLSNCINSGIRRIYVLTQYKSMSLTRHINLGWNIFNTILNEYINVIPAQQRIDESWYKGTADAIYQNFYILEKENPDLVLILAGDHVYKMDYRGFINFHIQNRADLTVAAIEKEKEASSRFGVIEVDKDFRMVGFQEKVKKPKTIPLKPDKILASMGIYIFNTETLVKQLIKNIKDSSSDHDFGKNIIPSIFKKNRVFVYNFLDKNRKLGKYWEDVGTIDAYYQANMDLIAVNPIFDLYDPGWPINTYHTPSPPARTVFNEPRRIGTVLNSLLSNGCIVSGAKIIRSIMSPNVRIHSYTQVEDSIIMDRVDIGRNVVIKKAIIDKEIRIPPGITIGLDHDKDRKLFTKTESGIVVVPRGFKFE